MPISIVSLDRCGGTADPLNMLQLFEERGRSHQGRSGTVIP
jgi:hypothetical protein